MFGGHWTFIVILLVIVLIIFGPGRLPELGGAIGKAMREFRKATNEFTNEMSSTTQPTKSEPPAVVPTVPSESAAKGSSSEANPPQS